MNQILSRVLRRNATISSSVWRVVPVSERKMGWKKVNKEGRKIKERATGRKAIKLLRQRSWAFENVRGVAKLSSEKVKLSSFAVSIQVST